MPPEEAWHIIFSNFDHNITRQQRLRLPSLPQKTSGPSKDSPLPRISIKNLSPMQYSCFFYDGHIIVGDEDYIKTHVLRYLYFVNQHDLSDSKVLFEYPLPLSQELDKIRETENGKVLYRWHQGWLAQQSYRRRNKQHRQEERRIMGPGGSLHDDSHGRCAICDLQI